MQTHRNHRIDLDEFLNAFTAQQAIGRHATTTIPTEIDGDVEVAGEIEKVMRSTVRIGCPVGYMEVSTVRDTPVMVAVTAGEAEYAIRATYFGPQIEERLAEVLGATTEDRAA